MSRQKSWSLHIPTAMLKPDITDPSEWVVWFDLDDTVWDFRNNSLEALSEVYDEFSLSRFWTDEAAWKSDYHVNNDLLWRQYAEGKVSQKELRFRRFYEPFTHAGMAKAEAEAASMRADGFYLHRLGLRSALVPGARSLLERVRARGFRTGLLSNGFREIQYAKMKSSAIEDLIDIVVLSDEIGINKPDTRIYRYAEEKAGVPACRCIMIGDNGETDIAGAVRAGWPLTVWFNPDGRCPEANLVDAVSHPCLLATVSSLDLIDL